MKKILFLILLLFLSVISYADNADDIIYAEELKTHVTIESSFDIIKTSNNYKIDYVTVKLSYLPINSYRQNVVSHITNPIGQDGVNSIIFNWDNPSLGTQKFSSEYILTSGSEYYPITKKVSFPINNLEQSVIPYTKTTEFIDLNDDIIDVANDIAQGKDDLYEVVFDAAVWVNQNIEYDLSTVTAEASLPSSWVLENKRGVCDEMTNLFISILRSLGIPARFVSGISYTNSELFDEPWGPHGWAEVYFPDFGWVPFDPTYGQYGFVDAGHLKLKESVDSDKSSIDFEWLSYGVSIEGNAPTNTVEVINKYGRKTSDTNIELSSLEDELGFGSYGAITAVVSNNVGEYRPLKLELVGTPEIEILEPTNYVMLGPNEKKTIAWKVKFPSDLDKRSLYTFPFSVYDNFQNKYDTDVTLSQANTVLNQAFIDAYLESLNDAKDVLDVDVECSNDDKVKKGSLVKIECSSSKKVTACFEGDCKIGDEFIFEKIFDKAGAYPLIISFTNGISKYFYSQIFVGDDPEINISWDETLDEINYNDREKVSFFISQESLTEPLNVEITLTYNNQKSHTIVDFENGLLMQFVINGKNLDVGDNNISINIKYFDEEGKEYSKEFNKNFIMRTNNFFETFLAKLSTLFYYLNSKLYI